MPSPLMPNQSNNISLPVSMTGVVQRMDPLTNLQVSFSAFCTVADLSSTDILNHVFGFYYGLLNTITN